MVRRGVFDELCHSRVNELVPFVRPDTGSSKNVFEQPSATTSLAARTRPTTCATGRLMCWPASAAPHGTTRRRRRRRQHCSHRSHRPSQPGGHGLGGRFPGPATRLVRLVLSSVPGNVDLGTSIHGVQSLETHRAVAVNPRRGPRVSHTLARYPHVERWGGAVIP